MRISPPHNPPTRQWNRKRNRRDVCSKKVLRWRIQRTGPKRSGHFAAPGISCLDRARLTTSQMPCTESIGRSKALAELDKYDEMPAVLADRAAQERGEMLRGLLQDAAARVQLAITPPDAEVHVDGRRSKSTGSDRVIRLNPGPHSVRVTRDGYVPTTLEVQVERGGRETHAIALTPRVAPPAPPAPPAAPKASLPVAVQLPESAVSKSDVAVDSIELGAAQPPPIDDDRKRFVKRPGFWAMIGAIAAVGIGAGVAIALTRKDDGPSCGTTGTCATTQGLTVTSF